MVIVRRFLSSKYLDYKSGASKRLLLTYPHLAMHISILLSRRLSKHLSYGKDS